MIQWFTYQRWYNDSHIRGDTMIHISEVIQWFTYQRWYNDSHVRGDTLIHISEVIQWFTYQRWYNDSHIRGDTMIHDCNMSITDIFNTLLFKGSNSHTVHWWLYCHMVQSLDTCVCIVRYSVCYLVTVVVLYINITLIFETMSSV